MYAPNTISFRQGEIGPRFITLKRDGVVADLSDASVVDFYVENQTLDGLYVDAACTVHGVPTNGVVRFAMVGDEFSTLAFTDTTEYRLRTICWVTYSDGHRVPFPQRESGVALVAANLPAL